MKPTDEHLKRLLEAAAMAPAPDIEAPPWGWEARILAAWRSSRSGSDMIAVIRFFRIGLGFAALLMLMIIALSLRNIAKAPVDEFAMPNVALNLALAN